MWSVIVNRWFSHSMFRCNMSCLQNDRSILNWNHATAYFQKEKFFYSYGDARVSIMDGIMISILLTSYHLFKPLIDFKRLFIHFDNGYTVICLFKWKPFEWVIHFKYKNGKLMRTQIGQINRFMVDWTRNNF